MEPDDPFTPDVVEKIDQAAREHGVTIAVISSQGTATILPAGTGQVLAESPQTPVTGEQAGRRILLADSGLSGGGFGRSMLRLSAGLALAASTMTAQAAVASPRKKAASLFARVPYIAAPGMDKGDLQRLQRQHAQMANSRSRYRPR